MDQLRNPLSTRTSVILLLGTGYLIYRVLKTKYDTSRVKAELTKQQIPIAKLPSTRELLLTRQRPDLFLDKLVQENGKIFAIAIAGSKMIVVAEPELIGLVLSKEFTAFTNRRDTPLNDKIFGNLLTTSKDEKWKRLRSIIAPTFSTGKLRQMKPRLDDTVATLVENFEALRLKNNSLVDVTQLFGAYSMDSIIQVAFGTKVDCLNEPNHPIIQHAKQIASTDITWRGALIGVLMIFFSTLAMKLAPQIMGFNAVMRFFEDFSIQIIRSKREELKQRGEGSGKANNFLEMLLEAEDEFEKLQNQQQDGDGKKKFISNDELIANCIQFFTAAYDTMNTTLSMVSYSLATNPECQEKLYNEIEENISKLPGTSTSNNPIPLISLEALNNFEYLNAVISESMRLYPVTPTERQASRDIKLASEDGRVEIKIKKGDILHFPVYSIQRDAEQFPDPDVFQPERWLGEPGHHKYAYLPFGQGPRSCVARSLALYQAKLAILGVVYSYKLNVCNETQDPPEFYLNGGLLAPKAVLLQVEKR